MAYSSAFYSRQVMRTREGLAVARLPLYEIRSLPPPLDQVVQRGRLLSKLCRYGAHRLRSGIGGFWATRSSLISRSDPGSATSEV